VLWNRQNCSQSSRREKYLKTMEFLQTVYCIGISVENHPKRFWISQIGPIFLVENLRWSSAFEKSETILQIELKIYQINTKNIGKCSNYNIKPFMKDILWFLIFQKAKLRHAFFTRIMGPIWLTQKPFGWFLRWFRGN